MLVAEAMRPAAERGYELDRDANTACLAAP